VAEVNAVENTDGEEKGTREVGEVRNRTQNLHEKAGDNDE
jgi:hypothetical protein